MRSPPVPKPALSSPGELDRAALWQNHLRTPYANRSFRDSFCTTCLRARSAHRLRIHTPFPAQPPAAGSATFFTSIAAHAGYACARATAPCHRSSHRCHPQLPLLPLHPLPLSSLCQGGSYPLVLPMLPQATRNPTLSLAHQTSRNTIQSARRPSHGDIEKPGVRNQHVASRAAIATRTQCGFNPDATPPTAKVVGYGVAGGHGPAENHVIPRAPRRKERQTESPISNFS